MPSNKKRTRTLFLTFNSKGALNNNNEELSLQLFHETVEDTKYFKDADKYVMSREVGDKEKKVHFHLALYREKKFLVDYVKIQSEMNFTHEEQEWVCNIGDKDGKCIDNIAAAYKYITKDGNFKTNYEEPPKGVDKKQSRNETVKKTIEESSTKEEFLENMKDDNPAMLVQNFNNVRAFAEYEYKVEGPEYVPKYEKDSFEVPEVVNDWYDANIERNEDTRHTILLLVGPTRIGKTQMIRSIGPHLYFKNLFSLEAYKKDLRVPPKYIVFDDFEYTSDETEPWFLGKFRPGLKPFTDCEPFILTDKYMRKMEVHGLPLVIVTNHMPVDIDTDYWSKNTTICLLEETDFCFKK
jgi:hypothetical protein